MPIEINFRPELIPIDRTHLFRFCRPKLLIVTDGLNYSSTNGFGLTQFINSLAAGTIYGMTPIIVKATRGADPNADISGFQFDHPTHGLTKSRYDVVFLFGSYREGSALPPGESTAIATFMQAGGGVFATGDHEDLGAGLSKDVPRVRNMRYWLSSETPDIGDTTRLSTNLPGDNDGYEFEDQSDIHPQRLYVNYRTLAGGVGNPHPLLQGGPLGQIEVFPDHPHEGECRIPGNLNTTFTLGGSNHDEWPNATSGGGKVVPEMVALTMSHGDSFPGKEALTPRSFIAIAAYDGHRANVGRVATDSTWHHFLNINIDGTGSARNGLQDNLGNDTPDLQKIRAYFKNLAAWLMPKHRRLCLSIPWLVNEFLRYPLFEEVRLFPLKQAEAVQLHKLGKQVIQALAHTYPLWQADTLIADALEQALGSDEAGNLLALSQDFGRLSGSELALAALGGMVTAIVETTVKHAKAEDIDVDKVFLPAAAEGAASATEKYYKHSLHELQQLHSLYQDVAHCLEKPPSRKKEKAAVA